MCVCCHKILNEDWWELYTNIWRTCRTGIIWSVNNLYLSRISYRSNVMNKRQSSMLNVMNGKASSQSTHCQIEPPFFEVNNYISCRRNMGNKLTRVECNVTVQFCSNVFSWFDWRNWERWVNITKQTLWLRNRPQKHSLRIKIKIDKETNESHKLMPQTQHRCLSQPWQRQCKGTVRQRHWEQPRVFTQRMPSPFYYT